MPQKETVSEVIRRALRSPYPRIKIKDLAKQLEVSEHVLNNHLYDRTPWRTELIERIRIALNKPVGWPYSDQAVIVGGQAVFETRSDFGANGTVMRPVIPGPVVLVPLVGRAGAGPVPVDPDTYLEDPEAGVLVPAEYALGDCSAVYAEGDSLLPLIQPGDKLVFRNTPRPRVNRIVAVRQALDATHPIVKELRQNGRELLLCSFNPTYKPLKMNDGDTMLGYLTAVLSADGTLRIGPELGGISGDMLAGKLQERLQGYGDPLPEV